MISIKEEIKKYNEEINKNNFYIDVTASVKLQREEMENKIHVLNVFCLYSKTQELIDSKEFEKNGVKYLSISLSYDFNYDLQVIFLNSNKKNVFISDNCDEGYLYHYKSFFYCAVLPDTSMYNLANNQTDLLLDVDKDLPSKLKDLFLNDDLRKVFDYSLLSSTLEEKEDDVKNKLKI